MTNLTVKNIPPLIYERLKMQAENNRRSINREVIVILEKALQIVPQRTPAEVKKILEETRKLREMTAGYVVTEEEINRWKKEGRE
ncbi:MAG: Arc family DNA-binding protein [Anaerolineales bacterium]|nr:Arc family DNA-binding protein [Anaerolineales bacterium]